MAPAPENVNVGSLTPDQARGIAGFEKIEVDVTSLSAFAEALRQEIDKNLNKAWDRIGPTLLDDEPRFGNSAELELGDKRNAYGSYLAGAKMFLRNVIEGVNQLADAAEKIGAAYSRADQFASVTATDVHNHLPTIEGGSTATSSTSTTSTGATPGTRGPNRAI